MLHAVHAVWQRHLHPDTVLAAAKQQKANFMLGVGGLAVASLALLASAILGLLLYYK